MVEAHNNLGTAAVALGHLDVAVAAFRDALAVDPGRAEIQANLGNVLHSLGRPDEAVAALGRARDLAPEDADILNAFGMALTTADRFQEAETIYTEAINKRPDFADAHYNLAGVLQKQGRSEETAEAYRRVLALDADNGTARHMLAALTGETPFTAPPNYVASLFDDFAPRFENKLVAALDYRIPERMRDTVELVLALSPDPETPVFRPSPRSRLRQRPDRPSLSRPSGAPGRGRPVPQNDRDGAGESRL